MSDPRRYLDDDGSQPLARKLLRSATKDGLDEARAEELARILAAATERTTAMAPSRGFSVAKWGLFAAVASLLVGGATVIHRNAPAPIASVDTVSVAPATASVVNDVPSPPPSVEGPATISASALPDAPAARANQPAKAGPVVSKASSDSDDLLAEARALERVRSAISGRRTDDARTGLEDYRRTFPKKLLAKEAQVLEIESLLAEGRRDEARERAQAFLAASPNSPYATRVRSLLAGRPLP